MLVEAKLAKKNFFFGGGGRANRPKSGPRPVLLPFSQVWFFSFSGNCVG